MTYLLIAVILLFPYKRSKDKFKIEYNQGDDRFIVSRCRSYEGLLSSYKISNVIGRTESLDVAKDIVEREKSKLD